MTSDNAKDTPREAGALLRGGSSTEVGRRQVNQDRVLVSRNNRLFVVADGMGGHRGGATAAELTVSELARHELTDTDSLRRAIVAANAIVYERSQNDPELHGMGTTVTAIALVEVDGEERIAVANVGDSRTYLLRNGEIEQLTEDHTLVAELIRDGQLTPDEARTHKNRSVVTRAIGVEEEVDIDLLEILPHTGDRYLLCSDGLSGEVNPAVMAATLRRFADPAEACRDLVRVALANGSKDNISAVVVEVAADGDAARLASAHLGNDPQHASESSGGTRLPPDATLDPGRPFGAQTLTGRTAKADRAIAGQKPKKRIITFRSLLFFALLGTVAGVAWWAVANSPSDIITDPTVPSTMQGPSPIQPSSTIQLSSTIALRTTLSSPTATLVTGPSTSAPLITTRSPSSTVISPSARATPTVLSGGVDDNFITPTNVVASSTGVSVEL